MKYLIGLLLLCLLVDSASAQLLDVDAGVAVARSGAPELAGEAPPRGIPGVIPSLDDPQAFVAGLNAAAKAGSWFFVLAILINGLVWCGRHGFIVRWVPWFKTQLGGYVLAGAMGVATVGSAQLAAWNFEPVALLFGALAPAAMAVGFYEGKRDASGQGPSSVPPGKAEARP